MWTDIVDLRDFYGQTLGQVACRLLRRRVRAVWPDLSGMRLLGLGFATPILEAYMHEAERVVAAMPARQGAMPWPRGAPGLATLIDDCDMPFADRMFDRILLVHALESSERTRHLMRECWRLLADGGRMIVIVPNRHGLWARLERTPFGQGRPYTVSQLKALLRNSMFMPVTVSGALFLPPLHSRMLLSSADAAERIGDRLFSGIGGVVVIEAQKQIYAATPHRQMELAPVRRYVRVPGRAAGI